MSKQDVTYKVSLKIFEHFVEHIYKSSSRHLCFTNKVAHQAWTRQSEHWDGFAPSESNPTPDDEVCIVMSQVLSEE